jgi:hypothetical protein
MLRVAKKLIGLSAPRMMLIMANPVRRNWRLFRNPIPLPRARLSIPLSIPLINNVRNIINGNLRAT